MLTVCHNPFDATLEREQLALEAGESVQDALTRRGLDRRYVVSCNGELLPPERGMALVPRETDDVQVLPQLQNAALKSIALIGVALAVTVFSGGLGGALLGAVGSSVWTASATAIAVANAAAGAIISIGGTLLVNGVASLFEKKPGGANYGVLGPQTSARSGIPIPKGYGLCRVGGNIVESWVDIQGNNGDAHDVDDGADTIGRQYVNVRVDFGFGPARSVSNLLLNGKDIAEYADVAYCILYGTNDQPPVTVNDSRWVKLNITTTGTTTNTQPTTGFDTVNNNYPQNQRVRAGIGKNYVVIPGQRNDTQKLTVFVSMPEGCVRYGDEQEQERLAISYDVYYRPAGSGDVGWVHVPGNGTPNGETHYYYNIRTTLLRQATIIDNLAPGCYDVKVLKNGSGAVHNPLDYFEHESDKFMDELWVESVQETSYTTLSYPNFIQVCVRFMATDQLAGADVTLTADIEFGLRSTLPAELAGLPENVPAAIAYDILSDDVIGADLDDSRIDLAFLQDWAALTQAMVADGDGGTQPLAVFNGVFDQDGVSIWDALGSVGVMSRANFQRVGVKVTGWLDQPDVPVQMFNVGSILQDSYSKTYLNLEDRAQEVEVDFADAADDYKTRNPIRVVSAGNESADEALKKSRVNLLGCTNKVQAYYFGALKLAENQNLLRTHTWKSHAQAMRCRTGNVVLLQHDVPEYGYGGLLQDGSTASSLVLDRDDLPWDAQSSYNVVVQHPALQRMTVSVSGINGNNITVAGYDGTTPVKRLQQGGLDIAVSRVNATTLQADDATGLVTGAASLWDLDVMETRAVTLLAGATAALSSPLSAVPVENAMYIYQAVSKVAVPVRIKQMKKKPGDQEYTLTAVDYSDDTYNIAAPVPGQSYTPPASTSDGTGATGSTPTAGAGSQAQFAVSYSESSQTVTKTTPGGSSYQQIQTYFTVTGIIVQNAGSGYTSSSKFVLASGYDYIDPATGQETKDPTVNLSATLDGQGGIVSLSGGTTAVKWNQLPSVQATR